MRTVLVAKYVNRLPVTEAECLEVITSEGGREGFSRLSVLEASVHGHLTPCFGPEVRQIIKEASI